MSSSRLGCSGQLTCAVWVQELSEASLVQAPGCHLASIPWLSNQLGGVVGEAGWGRWLFPPGLQGHLKVDEQDVGSLLCCLNPVEWLSLSGESKPSGSVFAQQCSPFRWSPTVIDSCRCAELPHQRWQCCPLLQLWGGKHYYLIKRIFLSDHLAPEFLLRRALTLLGKKLVNTWNGGRDV